MINFLLQTEIIPLCLRIMETGSELSKTVRWEGVLTHWMHGYWWAATGQAVSYA